MPRAPSPWNLGGLTVRELGRRVWAEIWDDEVTDRAAALAYYFLFALFPTLLFLTVLLGLLPLPGLMDRLLQYGDQALPGDAASIVRRTWTEINRGAGGGLLSIGVLTALWASSNGMASIMSALNVAYDVEDTRSWWKRRLLAVVLTFGFAVFILAALVPLVLGPHRPASRDSSGRHDLHVGVERGEYPDRVLRAGRHCPRSTRRPPLSSFWVTLARRGPGVVAGDVVGLRLRRAIHHNATYGSIGGIVLLMLWLYLTGVVLLVGAEINAEIDTWRPARCAHRQAPASSAHQRTRSRRAARGPCRRALTEDVAVAGRVIERWVAEARRHGWAPIALLGSGVLVGWLLRRRSPSEVARLAGTTMQIAAAIAAIERFRGQVDGDDKTVDQEPTKEKVFERAPRATRSGGSVQTIGRLRAAPQDQAPGARAAPRAERRGVRWAPASLARPARRGSLRPCRPTSPQLSRWGTQGLTVTRPSMRGMTMSRSTTSAGAIGKTAALVTASASVTSYLRS
jgi:membrane protein